jgi:hypothetical protein
MGFKAGSILSLPFLPIIISHFIIFFFAALISLSQETMDTQKNMIFPQ